MDAVTYRIMKLKKKMRFVQMDPPSVEIMLHLGNMEVRINIFTIMISLHLHRLNIRISQTTQTTLPMFSRHVPFSMAVLILLEPYGVSG